MPDLYIGMMSGTSLDGIDCALVEFSDGRFSLLNTHLQNLPKKLQNTLTSLALNETECDLDTFGEADAELGEVLAEAANQLLKKAGYSADSITAIGSHGQTIRHRPDAHHPFTIQIGDANKIAYLTGITTVADVRRRDIAAQGQGAPLTPAFHNTFFRSDKENRAIVNIGGISNITFLPADINQHCLGFDTGPGNMLMDAWTQRHKNLAYDKNGQWAASQAADKGLLTQLMQDPFISLAAPKSTGREHYNLHWLEQQLENHKQLSADTVQSTLCEFTSTSIQHAVLNHPQITNTVIICGGGAHNQQLIHSLQQRLPESHIKTSEHYGLHPDWVEAVAFAWLARQTINRTPANLPEVTGAVKAVILGSIFPA